MLNADDRERVIKSCETANLLVQDLRELVRAADPLLADVAIDLLRQAVEIEQRLKRIEATSRSQDATGTNGQ